MKTVRTIDTRYKTNALAVFFLLFCGFQSSFAANPVTSVSGIVYDSISGMPLSFVSVYLEKSSIGTMTDDEGWFEIQDTRGFFSLTVSFLGYETQTFSIEPGKKTKLEIYLKPVHYQFAEVVVKRKKEKYSKKNNPAIELIEKVIENKDKNRMENSQSWQFQQYEKFTLSFSNIDNAFETKGLFKMFKFLPEYLSASELDSTSILTASIKEALSDEYRNPGNRRSIVRAAKREGIDHFMEIESLDAIYSEAFFQEVNIFDNDMEILMKHFVSPLSSSLATSFYKYYILDTIVYKNDRCIMLDFAPYNVQDFGFTGRLWILPDNAWAVKKVELTIPRDNTVNFVKQMRVSQEFELLPSGIWAKSEESTLADFEASKHALGVYAKKSMHYRDYIMDSVPDSIFALENPVIEQKDAFNQSDSVWNACRMVPLQKNEQEVGELLDRMMQVSVFSHLMKVVKALVAGYIKTGATQDNSVFDIGPITTFISGNPLEGVRFRLGGMTTANLHPHLFWNGYMAYGTKDKVLKYASTLTYTFNEKKYHPNEYRKNNLALSYSYDVNTPGTLYSYIDKDNVLLSMRRGNNETMAYRRQALAWYEYESPSGFSFKIWTNNQNEKAAGSMQFLIRNEAGNDIDVEDYTSSAVGIHLRYARNEKIFQNRTGRFSFYRNAPVFGLSYTAGIKGYLKGEYAYHALEASVEKRFWFSAYGDVDITGKAGKIWGELPFPLLMIPNANPSYFMQPESFSLMNILEFVNDEYVALDLQFHFNGLLFNRLPFLRRLKLREVAGVSGLYGHLSDRNDPSQNPALFLFPAGAGKMTDIPYIEASVGVENILKILRIYYVRRLTYLENPGISKGGVRFAFTFTF